MKNRTILSFAIAIAMTMSVTSSATHAPPGVEKAKTEIVSTMNLEVQLQPTVFVAQPAVINEPFLTESVSEPVAVSAIVCPAVTQVVADVVLHDFGNRTAELKSILNNKRKPLLSYTRIYLSNCSIRQC